MSDTLLYIVTTQQLNILEHTLTTLLKLVGNINTLEFITLHIFNYIQTLLKLWDDYKTTQTNLLRKEILLPNQIITLQSYMNITSIDDEAISRIYNLSNISRIVLVSKEYMKANTTNHPNLNYFNTVLKSTNDMFTKLLLKYL